MENTSAILSFFSYSCTNDEAVHFRFVPCEVEEITDSASERCEEVESVVGDLNFVSLTKIL